MKGIEREAERIYNDPNWPGGNPEIARRNREGLAQLIDEWVQEDPSFAEIVEDVRSRYPRVP